MTGLSTYFLFGNPAAMPCGLGLRLCVFIFRWICLCRMGWWHFSWHLQYKVYFGIPQPFFPILWFGGHSSRRAFRLGLGFTF